MSLPPHTHIHFSAEVNNKKTCINVRNNYDYYCICTIRCATDRLKRDSEGVKQYKKYFNDTIFSGFEYPMYLRYIRTFKKRSYSKFQSYLSMSINIYLLKIMNL